MTTRTRRLKLRNHKCGWAIASQRRSKLLHQSRERWLAEAYIVYSRDKHSGAFVGDFAQWKTHENAVRVTQRYGSFPFKSKTSKQLLTKAGWSFEPTAL